MLNCYTLFTLLYFPFYFTLYVLPMPFEFHVIICSYLSSVHGCEYEFLKISIELARLYVLETSVRNQRCFLTSETSLCNIILSTEGRI